MRRRGRVQLIIWSLVAAWGCGSDQGPAPLPSCSAAQAAKVSLAAPRDTSIDATTGAGCATFPANTSTIDSAEYLVVAQAATSITDTSAAFQLLSATLAAARIAAQRLTPPSPPTTTGAAFDRYMRQVGRRHAGAAAMATGRLAAGAAVAPAATPPVVGSQRTFLVCGGLTSCSPFKSVTATALAVGLHVAIYVDTAAPKPGLSAADLDTLKQVFDTLLYPLATTNFGAVSDLDNNGVVIALMTPVVNSLVTAQQCATTGYLAGFFFPDDLVSAPGVTSNHGEIFYSIVADPLGSTGSCPHSATNVKQVTPGVFIHEFQHMINFAQHYVIHPGSVTAGSGEEGWLDEGLSKYAEELAARKYLSVGDTATFHQYLDGNDLYDASQYLAGTGSASLLIGQDQGTLAEIGASWLFVRYLMDQYGAPLAGKLDQTVLTGATNVQTQTGQSFTTLLERWALANWVSDLPNFTAPTALQYTSWHFRATFDTMHTRHPTRFPATYPLVPVAAPGSQISVSGVLHAGSGVYVRALQGPSAAAFTLQLSGPGVLLPAYIGPRYQVIRIR